MTTRYSSSDNLSTPDIDFLDKFPTAKFHIGARPGQYRNTAKALLWGPYATSLKESDREYLANLSDGRFGRGYELNEAQMMKLASIILSIGGLPVRREV